MHNRIRMLLVEEHRTLRKIDETRRKFKQQTRSKIEARANKHLTASHKEWAREQARIISREAKAKTTSLAMARENEEAKAEGSPHNERDMSHVARRTADDIKIKISLAKKTRAEFIKTEKREMESKRRKAQELERKENQKRNLAIRVQLERAHHSVEETRRRKIEEAKRETEMIMKVENWQIRKRERETRRLEKMELELLKRIQNSYLMERQVKEECEQSAQRE